MFLAEMAAVVTWEKLEARIDAHYPRLGPQGGRRRRNLALRPEDLQPPHHLRRDTADGGLKAASGSP